MQIKELENPILTKEQAKEQFDKLTKQLGIVHTFSFDEAYDYVLAKRKQNIFRTKITTFETELKKIPGTMVGDCYPLEHTFGDGTYIRKLTVPGGILTVTKIHAVTHPFFLMKGTISILTEEGIKKFTAPYNGITNAGTKRIIYHHDEVIFTTVHPNPDNGTDLSKIEDMVIAKTFDDLPDEDIKITEFIEQIKKEKL